MLKRSALLVVPSCLLLAGCGGGGGGGGSVGAGVAGPAPGTFTSFSAINSAGHWDILGSSVEGDKTRNGQSLVTQVTNQQPGSAKVSITLDQYGQATEFIVAGSRSTVNTMKWDAYYLPGVSNPWNLLGISADKNDIYVTSGPNNMGHDYQIFGVWETGLKSASGNFAAYSAGASSSASSVPNTGSGNFTGKSLGVYTDAGGNNYVTGSDARLTADFGARAVAVTTFNTQKNNTITYVHTAAPNLDLSGSLSYSAGTNSFSGGVSTSGGMSGTASGRFYGPAATEIGGTFSTKAASGVEHFAGAFGAKR